MDWRFIALHGKSAKLGAATAAVGLIKRVLTKYVAKLAVKTGARQYRSKHFDRHLHL